MQLEIGTNLRTVLIVILVLAAGLGVLAIAAYAGILYSVLKGIGLVIVIFLFLTFMGLG